MARLVVAQEQRVDYMGKRALCFQTFLDRRNYDGGCLSAQTLALDRPTRVGDRRLLSADSGDRAALAACPSRTYPAPGSPTTHHALALAVLRPPRGNLGSCWHHPWHADR